MTEVFHLKQGGVNVAPEPTSLGVRSAECRGAGWLKVHGRVLPISV